MNLRKLIGEAIKWMGIVVLAFPLEIIHAEAMQSDSENRAHIIFNLNKFIKWNNNSPDVTICFLGNDAELLRSLSVFEGSKISSSSVVIKQIRNVTNKLPNCQMLFIQNAAFDAGQLAAILQNLHNKTILTVSDIPGFAEQGGMIGIVWQQNRVKFEINLDVVKQENINVSSQLLSLAKIVNQ